MKNNRSRITVDPNGDWREHIDWVPIGFVPLGTVRTSGNTGALLFCEAMGKYIMCSGQIALNLNAQKVRAALGLQPTPNLVHVSQ